MSVTYQLLLLLLVCKEKWTTPRQLPAKQVSLSLFESVQAGYHTSRLQKRQRPSVLAPRCHGREQH
jgi:hypothetical protein